MSVSTNWLLKWAVCLKNKIEAPQGERTESLDYISKISHNADYQRSETALKWGGDEGTKELNWKGGHPSKMASCLGALAPSLHHSGSFAIKTLRAILPRGIPFIFSVVSFTFDLKHVWKISLGFYIITVSSNQQFQNIKKTFHVKKALLNMMFIVSFCNQFFSWLLDHGSTFQMHTVSRL